MANLLFPVLFYLNQELKMKFFLLKLMSIEYLSKKLIIDYFLRSIDPVGYLSVFALQNTFIVAYCKYGHFFIDFFISFFKKGSALAAENR